MLCMKEVGTFRTIHMMNHGMTILGATVGIDWYLYQEPLQNSQELSAGSGTKATLEQASASSFAAGTAQTFAVTTSSTRICFGSDFTAVQNFDLEDAFG